MEGHEPTNPILDGMGDGYFQGLTIRQYFASLAMQGMLNTRLYSDTPEHVAEKSVKYADALIKELNK